MRVAAETAASRQFVVAEPFSAKVPDSHAAAKVEEGIVRTDAHSAGVLVTPLGQQVCWQMGENMLFNVPADQLRERFGFFPHLAATGREKRIHDSLMALDSKALG